MFTIVNFEHVNAGWAIAENKNQFEIITFTYTTENRSTIFPSQRKCYFDIFT